MNPRERPDEYERASVFQRFSARLVDLLFMGVVIDVSASIPALPGIFVIALWFVALGYYFLCDGIFSGQGVGKRLFGIKVVDAKTGEPCSVGQAGLRVVIQLVPLMPLIEMVYLFVDGVQRYGDQVAKTYVVRVNPKPRPTPVENLRPIDYSRLGQTNLTPPSQNSDDRNG